VADVRIGAIKRLFEVGLQDRIVYNSLTPDSKPLELKTLQECKITSSILLAFNRLDFTVKGRTAAIKGKEGHMGLLATAQNIGIEKPLIDTVVLDLPSLSLACQAMRELKNELGYPVGCGAHNAIATWRGLKKKMPPEATKPCASFASAVPIMYGSDFILYGPIEGCEFVFPVCAMADALMAIENNVRPKETHPLRKIV
jgi:tetrahydromethanopterin S-methyltransferase subunit H